VHHADAGRECIARSVEPALLAMDDEGSLIGSVQPREDLAECTFPGAVFTAERVARPGGDVERYVAQRLHARKALGDVLELDGDHITQSS
jgi:hypothetical protein